MASGMSNYLEAKVLQFVAGTAMTPAPSSTFIALYTAMPSGADASGTEVSGNGYARVAIVGAGGWTASGTSPSQIANTAQINFPAASGGNWGTVVGVAVYDSLSAGHELYWGALTVNQTVNNGSTFSFAALALAIQLT